MKIGLIPSFSFPTGSKGYLIVRDLLLVGYGIIKAG
jgi:hypothetical protein